MSRRAPHIGRWQGGCLDNIAKELSTILHSGFNFLKNIAIQKICLNMLKTQFYFLWCMLTSNRRFVYVTLLIWINAYYTNILREQCLQRNIALRHMLLLLMKNESIFALYFFHFQLAVYMNVYVGMDFPFFFPPTHLFEVIMT